MATKRYASCLVPPLLCGMALSLSACAALQSWQTATTAAAAGPAAAPSAGQRSPQALAASTTVHGANGPLPPAAERATLERLAQGPGGKLLSKHLALLAAQGEVDLYRGNASRLLVDGPSTFAAMRKAIAAAQQRVLLESYIFEDAGIAAQMGELLAARAAAGVQVALLIDAVGSMGADTAFFEGLAARGVLVCRFNPLNPIERPGYWGVNHRNHRKLLVVDEELGYTGGINFSQVYSSGSSGISGKRRSGAGDALQHGWRDTQIELRGPVVPALAASFASQWQSQGCRGTLLESTSRRATPAGDRVVKLLPQRPEQGESRIYTALLSAIAAAERSVHLSMAYFAPGQDMVDALKAAARRGVEVVLVLPGTSDAHLVLQAGRAYYQELLEAGVLIHEMEHAVLHAKTATIDGVLSTVGSSNMDWRSFVMNSELNVLVLGEDFGAEMEALFARDRAASPAITAAAWAQRPWWQKLQQRAARWLEPLL